MNAVTSVCAAVFGIALLVTIAIVVDRDDIREKECVEKSYEICVKNQGQDCTSAVQNICRQRWHS